VHSGWLKGDFGDWNDDLDVMDDEEHKGIKIPNLEREDGGSMLLQERPQRPISIPEHWDAHVTVLILPALESYASTNRHHLMSREWAGRSKGEAAHDGMSFMIHRIEFVDEGSEVKIDRNARGRKARMAIEERKRREAADALALMYAGGAGRSMARHEVRVGA